MIGNDVFYQQIQSLIDIVNIIRVQIILRGMHRGRQNKLILPIDKKPVGSIKTPFLLEHSTKIKLSFLKEKIIEKKRISTAHKANNNVNSELSVFLQKINMGEYLGKLIENGIDSLQILKEVKQAQLQQLGIAKGHALKIMISVAKHQQTKKKKIMNEQNKQMNKSTFDVSIRSEETITHKSLGKIPEQANDIQTESIPLQRVKKSFCLYCYSRSENQFCSDKCEQLYNGMFQKYEQNLQKAEDDFTVPLPNHKELEDNQQFLQNFDFLFEKQVELDEDEYERIKQLMKQ